MIDENKISSLEEALHVFKNGYPSSNSFKHLKGTEKHDAMDACWRRDRRATETVIELLKETIKSLYEYDQNFKDGKVDVNNKNNNNPEGKE